MTDTTAPTRFAVLGAGTWGTTLADVLDRNGHDVICWDIDRSLTDRLTSEHRHPRLPGLELRPSLRFTRYLGKALSHAQAVVLVVPSQAMRRSAADSGHRFVRAKNRAWIICSKGIERDTNLLMHESA